MLSSISPSRLVLLALLGSATLVACSNNDRMSPVALKPGNPRNALIANGNIAVCKVAGPPGTYTFHVDVSGGGNFSLANGPDTTVNFDGTEPACWSDAYATVPDASWTTGLTASVTITETQIPTGVVVDSIEMVDRFGGLETSIIGQPVIVIQEGVKDLHTVNYFNAASPSVTCAAINAIANVPIVPVQLTATGGSGGPYTFSATGLPTGLSISTSGLISGTPTATGSFNYYVTVTDNTGHVGKSAGCTVTVNAPPSADCVGINAVRGVPITPVQLHGTGGTGGPYHFSSSDLPTGLSISDDGTISGTPTVTGNFTYHVTVKDKDGNVGTLQCSVTVNPPPAADCVNITAVEGTPITPVTMVGSGGNGGPYTFSATGLPAGLTMSSSGTISGTPTVSGTFIYTVTVTDKDGNSSTVDCSVTVSNPPCPDGSFTFSYNLAGDLLIKYDQFPAPNDNSYGVNAVGWGTHGHKFTDLVGSDHAGFQLVDPTNTVKLSFNIDYISASSTAPSGYASLVTGGDGSMLVGTADGITATSSLANNLNNINIPGLFNPTTHVQQFGSVNVLLDSPPTDASHLTYNNSDPALAGWDFHDTYYVTISAAKLASIGFDRNTWKVQPNLAALHNSPAKACPTGGGTGGSSLAELTTTISGKEIKISIQNNGPTDVFLTDVSLNWPTSPNGKFMQLKMGPGIVYDKPDIAGGTATLSTTSTTNPLIADQNKRKIPHGKAVVVDFVFEKNVDTNVAHYLATLIFSGQSISVLP